MIRRRDVATLTAITVALRLPAFLADRHLTFDDGVYGASAVAMRAGGAPFRDVFSSQGPLFLPLVWIADLLGLRTANAPRLLAVGAGIALVLATLSIAAAVTDRRGAILAAGLTTACASTLWVTGPTASDGVGLAFASIAIALAFRWEGRIDGRRAIAVGLAVGCAISVKALILGAVVPVAVLLLAQRRLRPILLSAVTAVGFHLVLWLPFGVADVWDQSYGYHLEVAGSRTPGANLAKVASTLGDRDLPVVAALLLGVVTLVLSRRRAGSRTPPAPLAVLDLALLAWLAASLLVLALEHPLWRPHVSQLIPVLAVLAARFRAPWRVLGAAALVVVPYHLVHAWDILWPSPYPAEQAAMVATLAALPDGALAISDEPGLVWRAGRRTTDDLVDASKLRMETGDITPQYVASTAARADVCAVAVTSGVRWGSFDELPALLAAEGYEVAYEHGTVRRVYVKTDCAPPPD